MYLLIYHGFDHPDAQAALRRLVRMHRRHEIANEHYLYVLACLMVVPTRWIARYGPRPLNEAEVESTYYFYRTLGERMGVRDIPATYHEVQVWFDGYDAEHLRPNAAGSRLMNASRGLLVDRFPTWARPLAARLSDAMLDPPLRQALGAEEPGWIARSTLLVVMRIRAFRCPAAQTGKRTVIYA